jgi:hypothetical protein
VLEYVRYAGRDHLTLVAPDSPLVRGLLDWTRAQFEGAPAPAPAACRERSA